jgi:ketosteroid isomerase-like protein
MNTQQIDSFVASWTNAERDGDVATLDTLIADDFVGVGPLGFTLPKAAWLARHTDGALKYEAFAVDEVDARPHSDATVITARHTATGAYSGQPIPTALRATLVLVDDEGRSRLAALHLSFIAGTPGAPPIPGAVGPSAQ